MSLHLTKQVTFYGHPSGLILLFITQMCERFSIMGCGQFASNFNSNDVTQLIDLFISVVWLGFGAGLTIVVTSGI